MTRFALLALAMCALVPASSLAQTAIGTGISSSTSRAAGVGIGTGTAISGQGGGGGNATSGPSTVNITSSVPPTQTINSNSTVSGTQSLRNVPTVFAPGLTAAGLETCLGSVSGGGGWLGTGFSFGTTIPDPGCNARLTARQLWSFGLKAAAVARLCLDGDVYRSMPDVCLKYLPQQAAVVGASQAAAIQAPYRGPGPLYGLASSPPGEAAYIEQGTAMPARSGPILLVEGKTGLNRLCNDYDEARSKCRKWAYSLDGLKQKKTAPAGTVPKSLPKIIVDPPPAPPPQAADVAQ